MELQPNTIPEVTKSQSRFEPLSRFINSRKDQAALAITVAFTSLGEKLEDLTQKYNGPNVSVENLVYSLGGAIAGLAIGRKLDGAFNIKTLAAAGAEATFGLFLSKMLDTPEIFYVAVPSAVLMTMFRAAIQNRGPR